MRGHIRKRSQDSYTVVLELDKENGKRKQQWVTRYSLLCPILSCPIYRYAKV